ncbi:MAG: hypothetical protein AAGJ19_03405 [Myxococcota bacterium]
MRRAALGLCFLLGCATPREQLRVGPLVEDLPLGEPTGLWRGLAAMEAVDPEAAGRAWSDHILAQPRSASAVTAAELLSQLELPYLARFVKRAESAPIGEAVQARLAWTGWSDATEHWVRAMQARALDRDGGWTARAERGGRLRAGGGAASGLHRLESCARFSTRTTITAWVWSDAFGEIRLDGVVLRDGDRPSVDLEVELAPGLHRLEAELRIDDEDDALALWFPEWSDRAERCTDEVPASREVRWIPTPEARGWKERFVAARVSEAGVARWPRQREALVAPVPELARRSPALMGAWARWATDLGVSAARVLEELDGELSPWGRTTRATALSGVDPEAAHEIVKALNRPRLHFAFLIEQGRGQEALAIAHRLKPGQMSTSERIRAADFFIRSGWPGLADRFVPEFLDPLAEARWFARSDLGRARRLACSEPRSLESRLQCAEWALVAENLDEAKEMVDALHAECPAWAPLHRLRRRLTGVGKGKAAEVLVELRRAGERRTDWELAHEGELWRPELPFEPASRLGPKMKAERGGGNDRVVVVDRRWEDWLRGGARWATTHVLERVQTRGGIDAVGQVSPPPDAAVLRIRTLNGEGASTPAEHREGATDLSFVDLEPMDGAEIEWSRIEATPSDDVATRFSHRGRQGVEFSELVIRTPKDLKLAWASLQGAPEPTIFETDRHRLHRWRIEGVPPWREEPHAPPPRELLPITMVWVEGAQSAARRRNREALALPPSPWAAALGRRLAGGRKGAEAYRAIFEWVRDEISPGSAIGARGLLEGRADRTRLLAQMTAGLGGQFVLARSEARWPSKIPDPHRYDRPLVLAEAEPGRLWMGFDGPSSWFGRLPADYRGGGHLKPDGRVRVFDEEDIGPEHLDVVLEISAQDTDGKGRLQLRAIGRWRGRLREILEESGADEVEAQLERGLSEALGTVDVSSWARTEDGLSAEFIARALFQRDGPRLRMRRLDATPLSEILLGLPGPEALIQPARRRSELRIEERSERFRLEMDLPSEAVLRPPRSFSRSAGWGRFIQRFEDAPGTFALERSWSWSSVRIPPEDMSSFVAAMERLVDDSSLELDFVLRRD